MKLQLIRHATLLVNINGVRILVDPMLSSKGEMEPVKKLTDFRRNPTVELPFNNEALIEVLENIDGVLVTHTHRDHFDNAAAGMIPRSKTVICQPGDECKFKELGFKKVVPVNDCIEWNRIEFIRTSGHHGRGKSEEMMGTVSGFIIKTKDEPILYIAGDTILCKEVEDTIEKYKPDVTVVNAGAASLLTGGPITMTAEDIEMICSKFDRTKVVAVHMEAFNHCSLSREKLKSHMEGKNLGSHVEIPQDGEVLTFANII